MAAMQPNLSNMRNSAIAVPHNHSYQQNQKKSVDRLSYNVSQNRTMEENGPRKKSGSKMSNSYKNGSMNSWSKIGGDPLKSQ